jgi:hypothetical protein
VSENPFQQLFLPQSGQGNRGYLYTDSIGEKRQFNIYKSANSLKRKQLALITALFCPYMVLVPVAVKVEFDGGDSGKTDYRHR